MLCLYFGKSDGVIFWFVTNLYALHCHFLQLSPILYTDDILTGVCMSSYVMEKSDGDHLNVVNQLGDMCQVCLILKFPFNLDGSV